MFFKGTKSRREPGQVHRELDKIGADATLLPLKGDRFWVKRPAKDFDIALDVISDILLEPLFKEEEAEKEKCYFSGIEMRNDNPRLKTQKIWRTSFWRPAPSAGISPEAKIGGGDKKGRRYRLRSRKLSCRKYDGRGGGQLWHRKCFQKSKPKVRSPPLKGKNKSFIKAKNISKRNASQNFQQRNRPTPFGLSDKGL